MEHSGYPNRRQMLRGGVALAASVSFLAACGSKSASSDKKESPAAGRQSTALPSSGTSVAATSAKPAKKGGRFVRDSTLASNNYHVYANYAEGYNLSGMTVYDRLMTAKLDDRRYQLEAVASVEQPEPLRIVLKLKPGMTFHNVAPVSGRAVKADDIVAAQDFLKTFSRAENNGFQRQFLAKAEAPDDTTVVYTLAKPFAYLFASTQLCNPTGQAIVPKEQLPNLDNATPIGSGPYVFAEATMNSRYLYKRNDKYRDAAKGLPYIDEREVLVINDPVAQEAAFRSGQTMQFLPPPSVVDRIVSEMGSKIVDEKFLSPGQFTFNLQMKRAPWTDMRVREAIYRLTDRQQFVNLVYRGKAVVPAGPMMAGLKAYQLDPKDTAPYFKNDVAEARKLLESAGWDFNKEFEISINTNPVNNQAGEVWQQQLAKAGFKVRPTPLPFAEWLPNRVGKGDFDLIIGSQPGGDTPYRAMRNHHSDTLDVYNNVGLQDKEIDAMIEKSEVTLDFQENVKLVKQIQLEVLKRYSGQYIIVTEERDWLRWTYLQNYTVDALNGQEFRQDMWIDQ